MTQVRLRDQARGSGPICRRILGALPGWFGIAESVDDYVSVADRSPTVIASLGGDDVGILTVVAHGAYAAEIYVMAVLPEYHRQGIGRRMLRHVEDALAESGVEFLQVKTLSPARRDEGYEKTRAFYRSCGFRPLEEFPRLWNPENPALQMVKAVPHPLGVRTDPRQQVLARFRWVRGHADVWRIFADAEAMATVTAALAEPWRTAGITKVCGIESRGFLLGGAVAVELHAGFVAIRKEAGLFAGDKHEVTTAPDYREVAQRLRIQTDSLGADDVVLLVDDWAERGSQALGARALLATRGATWAGASLVVDQLRPETRERLAPVTSIVTHNELPAFGDRP